MSDNKQNSEKTADKGGQVDAIVSKLGGFAIMGNKGFHITFSNGVTLSTQIGGGNYCDNYNFQIGEERDTYKMQCANAELAIWKNGGEWITKQMYEEIFPEEDYCGDAIGHIDIEKWLKIVEWCKNWAG